jgi:hypothetical protein
MERTYEDRYTDLLRHLGNPSLVNPEELAEALRSVEHMYSMGHITAWQLKKAKEAYAETIARDPDQGPPSVSGELGN